MFLLLKEMLAKSVSDAAGVTPEDAMRSIELPKGQFGDVASSICFSLAKKERKNPVELAKAVAGKMKLPEWVEKAQVAGPYINFTLSGKFYSELLSKVGKEKEKFGKGTAGIACGMGEATASSRKKKKGKTIVEFPSVNPNKPWHIGHLRNALLGDAVARILEFSGEPVQRTDYIDDLGLQVAQSFWGYKKLGGKPSGKLDLWLGEQYVEVSKKFEADEKVQDEVRKLLREMEEGKGGTALECRELVEKCVAAQYETAFKFSVYHDVMIFESDIMRTIFAEGLELLKKNGAIVHEKEGKNSGCWVAKMTSPEFAAMENPDKILIRSDGTATYTGKDVIFQLWKFGILKNDFTYSEFMRQPNGADCMKTDGKGKKGDYRNATRVVNVIGMEQAYPQKVIKEILKNMGYEKEAENSVHLAYEHVGLAETGFSGRQGTWLGFTADELYDEGVKRAEVKIKEDVTGAARKSIAVAVASAAIRYSFIRTTPEKKIIFKWDDALSMDGDSAPYIMYAHARAHKIVEKGGAGKSEALALETAERELLKKVMMFGAVVDDSARHLRPHVVAEYCLDLATLYNKFYNVCPVIACEDEKTRENRLAINSAAKITLSNALRAIGIEALEKM